MCSDGLSLKNKYHTTAHITPIIPKIANVSLQPTVTINHVNKGIPNAPPNFCPLSNNPATVARSLFGNHFLVIAALLGYAPASPIPNTIRQSKKDLKPLAKPVNPVAIDHQNTDNPNIFLCPNLSEIKPAGICNKA